MKEPRNSSAYMSRSLSYKVSELNRFYPCILVTGARQVGKSTLLQHMLPAGMKYVSSDIEDAYSKIGMVKAAGGQFITVDEGNLGMNIVMEEK